MPTQGNQLQLSFGVNAPESRAIHKDATLPDNSPVGVKLDGYADYANLVYKGTTTGGTQAWALTEGSVTLTDTKGTIYAYWPYSSTTSIDAIDVDMTTADQTDWLYATPVTGICEDKAEAAVTMNHAAANINVTINKGTYLGSGAISNITVQSDGIALGGTFNAAQATPDYTAFEDEGKPLSRDLSATTGAATDIMVVPTGASAAITFTATIDGIQFAATSAAVKLAMGNSYQYTLNLSDISTYMEISGFSVKPWNSTTGGTLDLEEFVDTTPHVYAVSSTGLLIDYNSADATATGVALVAGEHKFMIAKSDATDGTNTKFYWAKNLYGKDVKGIVNNGKVYGGSSYGYLPKPDGTWHFSPYLSGDYTIWKTGALAEFNGAANTAAIIAGYTEHGVSMDARDMCSVLNTFNASDNFKDWYVPACGQLALMYLNMTEINAVLTKIGGTALADDYYWSSSEYAFNPVWSILFQSGYISDARKDGDYRVRFVRDI